MIEAHVLLAGVFIFFARICDVAIGTIRTIATVQGRTGIAFVLAMVEITIWVLVTGTVINQILRPVATHVGGWRALTKRK
jgi:uncharacterized protein YebE (UPF0316 family)